MRLLVILLTPLFVFAQGISVIPNNVDVGLNLNQVGNIVRKNSCNQMRSKKLSVTVVPTCYGANLRHASHTIDPNGGDVKMKITVKNSGEELVTETTFSPLVTRPETYGQECRRYYFGSAYKGPHAKGHYVVCNIYHKGNTRNVEYKCSHNAAKFFLNDYLSCTRSSSDTLAQGELNKKVKCGYMYSWKGTGYAAKNSYIRSNTHASCGIRSVDKLTAQTDALKGVTGTVATEVDSNGQIQIMLPEVTIPKRTIARNLASKKLVVSGKASQVSVSFHQNQKKNNLDNWVKLDFKGGAALNEAEDCLDINAAFLGKNQYCGSYYSPLMFFFDKKLPKFIGRSSFPLIDGVPVIYWVESNASGHFLALDRNGDKKINGALELFGNQNTKANGFEALAKYDHNNDGRIDKNDMVFKNLILWNDKNGNGQSEKSEMVSLKDLKIESINLDYSHGNDSFEGRAEARERSSFIYDGGKKGFVYDIWFSPAT